MSNKIIQMCCQDISLDRIFEGYVVSSRQSLHDCISCMTAWKDCYLHAAQMHNRWVVGQLNVWQDDLPPPCFSPAVRPLWGGGRNSGCVACSVLGILPRLPKGGPETYSPLGTN
ncbi:hypothetical protein KIL84_012220 [Mauremys mutica]|uniref:Uncharacterized protein n=1 Tax=Mauremys mutica TaxID=74926 RepID=A0A9D3XEQ2_9SAUR|nr:hypothetical protein KIL84_012220 [Mauremys mutica]